MKSKPKRTNRPEQVPCSPAFKAWLEKLRQERRQTYIVCLDRLMEEQGGKKPYVNNCV